MTRWVGYLRVSTDQQTEGYGLDVQRASIEAWAATNDHTVVAWSRDEGVSGSLEPAVRDGWQQARHLVGEHDAAGIVVARMDRLSRDFVGQEITLRELRKHGVELVSVAEPEACENTDDPQRVMVRQMLGVLAEYERKVIRQRMEAGKARKKAEGGFAGGMPPYGWRPVNKELEPDAAEQIIVGEMRRQRAAGVSYRGIADLLNERGVPSKTGKRWHPPTVRDVLAHPLNEHPIEPKWFG